MCSGDPGRGLQALGKDDARRGWGFPKPCKERAGEGAGVNGTAQPTSTDEEGAASGYLSPEARRVRSESEGFKQAGSLPHKKRMLQNYMRDGTGAL